MSATVPPNPRPSRAAPSNDPAEALERIVPRGRLKPEDGDIVIMRAAGGFQSPGVDVYELRVRGGADRPERFAGFDRAAASGEQLANARKVRLFYVDGDGEPPRLLNDFRAG